jgi:hypothetical protein
MQRSSNATLGAALNAAGYPLKADPARINIPMLLGVADHPRDLCDDGLRADRGDAGRDVPDAHRYTSMSLPYHIGNGWFGGFLPTTAFAIVAATGNIYSGLWYPVTIAVITLVIGTLFVKETKDVDLESA